MHLNVGATALDSESAIGKSMTDSEPDHEVPAVFAEVPRFQVVTVPDGCATVLYPPDPTVSFVRIEVGTTVQQLLEAESRLYGFEWSQVSVFKMDGTPWRRHDPICPGQMAQLCVIPHGQAGDPEILGFRSLLAGFPGECGQSPLQICHADQAGESGLLPFRLPVNDVARAFSAGDALARSFSGEPMHGRSGVGEYGPLPFKLPVVDHAMTDGTNRSDVATDGEYGQPPCKLPVGRSMCAVCASSAGDMPVEHTPAECTVPHRRVESKLYHQEKRQSAPLLLLGMFLLHVCQLRLRCRLTHQLNSGSNPGVAVDVPPGECGPLPHIMPVHAEELLKDVTSTRHANVAPAGGSVGGVVHSADVQEPRSALEGGSSLSVPGDPVTFASWPGGVPNCASVARSPLVYFEADGLSRMQSSFPTTQAVVNSMRQHRYSQLKIESSSLPNKERCGPMMRLPGTSQTSSAFVPLTLR